MYNNDVKSTFKNEKIREGITYIHTFERLFKVSEHYEDMLDKDLAEFSSDELLLIFKSIAKSAKYTTVVSYNSLVGEYKSWSLKNGMKANKDICTVDELQSIESYKQYVILTEGDILNVTQFGILDGADYNVSIFLKLFWEIEGQESVNDILRLRMQDIDFKNRSITIYRTVTEKIKKSPTNGNKSTEKRTTLVPITYKNISRWLINTIEEFAKETMLTFENGKKHGRYRILSAEENEGYIFRTTFSSRTVSGKVITAIKFSNMMYQFCQRHSGLELITVNDLLMSLALRHMIISKKTHAQMYTEGRYFKNMLSSVYADVFRDYAEIKYPKEFKEYCDHYLSLETISK